jgi:hypothetical protein
MNRNEMNASQKESHSNSTTSTTSTTGNGSSALNSPFAAKTLSKLSDRTKRKIQSSLFGEDDESANATLHSPRSAENFHSG